MELSDEFYRIIEEQTLSAQNHTFKLSIDPMHPIFEGHFPGYKVTPGVVLLKIIGELVGKILHRKFLLSEIKSAKFMSVIRPEEISYLKVDMDLNSIDSETHAVQAQINADQTIAFKGSLIFRTSL